MSKKTKFYTLDNILAKKATYNIIFGERSNGKTYSVLKRMLENYITNGKQGGLIRRWSDDFKGKRGQSMFDALVANDEVRKLSGNQWTDVYYFSGRWYLCRYEDGKRITDERPFCYGFAISGMEHDKSTSYPDITIILFDEMLTRQNYLPDEFVLFLNCISTIVRQRTDVIIFMCGNTVNKYCPYFAEMGLTHIRDMKPGSIDVYTYGNSKLSVAVEYVEPSKTGKPSDLYFAFDNPKLQMITGGAWEIGIYPRSPVKIRPCDVLFTYFIEFDTELLTCQIVKRDNYYFTFIHKKTTPLEHPDKDLIYSTQFDARPNYRRKITKPRTDIEKRITEFYYRDKVFYDSNETGEIVRNYLLWCGKEAV